MIHPSYNELINAINANTEDDDNTMLVNSRYSLVLATSKRARQLIAGSRPKIRDTEGKKPLSIAIEELYNGKVKILEKPEEEEEKTVYASSGITEESLEEEAGEKEMGQDDPEDELFLDEEDEPYEEGEPYDVNRMLGTERSSAAADPYAEGGTNVEEEEQEEDEAALPDEEQKE